MPLTISLDQMGVGFMRQRNPNGQEVLVILWECARSGDKVAVQYDPLQASAFLRDLGHAIGAPRAAVDGIVGTPPAADYGEPRTLDDEEQLPG